MTLTHKQKREYLVLPGKCPHCGGDGAEGGEVQREADGPRTVKVAVYCRSCTASWTDIYQLVGVEDDDGPEKLPDPYDNRSGGGVNARERLIRKRERFEPNKSIYFNPNEPKSTEKLTAELTAKEERAKAAGWWNLSWAGDHSEDEYGNVKSIHLQLHGDRHETDLEMEKRLEHLRIRWREDYLQYLLRKRFYEHPQGLAEIAEIEKHFGQPEYREDGRIMYPSKKGD